ncbi:DUF1934 domain-containing protein [Peribacillus acanthi]|uniref:DUF1934 domain-containing protein n=1 Tax=Peribacillus acanthi TaxID=2171554 RepID=UPI0013008A54|nr:DUF1934 domain-containing protein [Peribacillus acanthi]
MSEQKDVKVTLKTVISSGNEKEEYEFITFGTAQTKGETLYLQYDEIQDDNQERIQTVVKWNDEEAFIMRKGPVKMRQRFRRDVETVGIYESQYGSMQMLTYTNKMEYTWNNLEKEGIISLIYDLNMQGNKIGQYEMTILYKEEQK